MKKILCLIIALGIYTTVSAQQNPDSLETLIPNDALLVIQTNEIKKVIVNTSQLIHKYLSDDKYNLLKSLDEFKEKTGINLLDNESLSQAGIDINGKAGLAFYKPEARRKENIVILLPIYDEKMFPLKFVEIIKKLNANRGDMDIYPVITQYKTASLFQIRKDIFASAAGGYFIIAPNGEMVKRVIDIYGNQGKSIASDARYLGYKSNAGLSYDINIFIRKEFLSMILGPKQKPEPKSEDVPDGKEEKKEGFKESGYKEISYELAAVDRKKRTSRQKNSKLKEDDIFNAIEYIAGGLSYVNNSLLLNVGTDFNKQDAGANALLDFFTVGRQSEALDFNEFYSYIFLSADPAAIEKYCGVDNKLCSSYDGIKKDINKMFGIDFVKNLLPVYNGTANFIIIDLGEDTGGIGKYILYLSTKTPAGAKMLWEKMKSHMAKDDALNKKLKVEKKFGVDTFWVDDAGKKNGKLAVFYTEKGFFVANDDKGIEAAVKAKTVGDAASNMGKNIKGNMFLYSKVNSQLVRKATSMVSSKYAGLFEMLNSLTITGMKNGSYMSSDIIIELRNSQKK